jgi:hypothetical protein
MGDLENYMALNLKSRAYSGGQFHTQFCWYVWELFYYFSRTKRVTKLTSEKVDTKRFKCNN